MGMNQSTVCRQDCELSEAIYQFKPDYNMNPGTNSLENCIHLKYCKSHEDAVLEDPSNHC